MAIKKYRPMTAGTRGMSVLDFNEITTDKPEKSLLEPQKKMAGRNNQGKLTVRHQGGGVKQKYRIVDFKRDKDGIPGTVATIEYDPNRTANIALIFYADGEKRYIIAPLDLNVGDTVMSGDKAEIRPGNNLPLKRIPLGTQIHNVELTLGRGGQLARAAGASAQLMAKEGSYAQVRLPSGESRMVNMECTATIGQVGNVDHGNINLGKAGRKRWMGIRPGVRGTAMDPNSHPHGGGEGRTGIGMAGPKTPWGKPALGYKTRVAKPSDKYIVRRRGKKRR